MADENPYKLRGMIPIDSGMFFGREREMRRIADLLSGEIPQCVSIIGERRIGKSSLVNRIIHKLRQTAPGSRAVYLDCDGFPEDCLSKDRFFQFLNQKFLVVLNFACHLFPAMPKYRMFVHKPRL